MQAVFIFGQFMSVHALSSCSLQISLLKGIGATRNVMTRLPNEAIASDMTAAGINVTDAPFIYIRILAVLILLILRLLRRLLAQISVDHISVIVFQM